jgi:FG-GAP-like repeat
MIARILTTAVGGALLLAYGQPSARPRFEAAQPALFASGGTFVNAFADYDRDGDADLFVGFNATGGAANRLYRNDRGTFADVAATAGLAHARPTRAAAWGDYDGDGDPDLAIGFAPGDGSVLTIHQNSAGRFVDVTAAAHLGVEAGAIRQLAWIDLDADGDLDLFAAFRDRANALFRNDTGVFVDIAAEIGVADARKSVGAVWFDADEDGDLDLYVGNMDGDANGFYRNEKGKFTDVAEAVRLAWGHRTARDPGNGTVRPCAADVDGDGRLDLVTANYGKNGVFLNRGGLQFEDVSEAWGIAIDSRYDTCALADIDHDGRLDLYVNGTVTGGTSYRDYLFRNTGAGFEDVTPENLRLLHADHGAAWADADGDGDVDLALTGSRADGMHLVLMNQLPRPDAKRSLAVRPLDARGRATLAGAEVHVFAAGSTRLLATRLVDSGSGYNAQNDIAVHIGLPHPGNVDVVLTYPAAGSRRTVTQRNIAPSGQTIAMKIR